MLADRLNHFVDLHQQKSNKIAKLKEKSADNAQNFANQLKIKSLIINASMETKNYYIMIYKISGIHPHKETQLSLRINSINLFKTTMIKTITDIFDQNIDYSNQFFEDYPYDNYPMNKLSNEWEQQINQQEIHVNKVKLNKVKSI